jgi:membrane-associated phospholipid phosphatase
MPASELPAAAPSVRPSVAAIRDRHVPAVARADWLRLWASLRACFWLKAIGTTSFMWLFFVGYFHLLRHPVQPALDMPLTSIDRWMAFRPWALWPYISLWVYVALPPGLLSNSRELIRYGWWIGGLCLAGLACFYLWPTAVPHLDVATASQAGFDLLRGVDAAGNACPSLHVATATFSALWLDRLLRDLTLPRWLRAASALWFLLIVWSTLAIKQHVWWDVVAGVALALAFALPSLRGHGARRGGDIIAP